MSKVVRAAAVIATAMAVAGTGVATAEAAPVPEVWPYISPNNGDVLHNSPVKADQLPGSSRDVYNAGYLDEVLVGFGIASIVAIIIGTTVVNTTNLDQTLHGQYIDRLPF